MKRFSIKKTAAAVLCLLLTVAGAAAPKIKEQPLTLTTKDGWPLAAVYRPAGDSETVVVLLHDLGKNKEAFSAFEKALDKVNVGYLAVDLRGHGKSISKGEYKTFAKEGEDNPFNQMVQDGQAAIDFLKSKKVAPEQIILLGTGLGANLAAKLTKNNPNILGIGLISPSANIRDVLPVPALRAYKGAVLVAASAGERKGFLEASILRNVAFLTTGEGKVTFLTAYDLAGHELLDRYLTGSTVQWVLTPVRPEIKADKTADDFVDWHNAAGTSPTNGGLLPSVLLDE